MFNLIKYELRGRRLTIVGICLMVILGNIFLMTKVGSWQIGVPLLSTILGIGALILMFISSLSLLSDYLYDEQGYLLFTLPQSGISIIASRLIVAGIQMSIVTIVAVGMFCLIDQQKILNAFLGHTEVEEILYSAVVYLWSLISLLTFIYFCMVVGKIALHGKKMGKIGSFIIFIILGLGWNGLTVIVSNLFPQTVELGDFTTLGINIGTGIVDVIIFGILFMTTSYLLENKVDL